MALQFQPPSFVKPVQPPNISGGIDELYNNYLRQKAFQQDQQLKGLQIQGAQSDLANSQLQRRLSFGGVDPTTLTEQDWQQAMQPQAGPAATQAPQAQSGLPQAQPAGPQSTPGAQPSNLAPAETPENPHVAPLRAFLQMRGKTMAVDLLEKMAGLGKTQAEASKTGAEASKAQALADMLGGGSKLIPNMLDAVQNGRISPSQADDYLGRNPDAHMAYLNAAASKGLDLRKLENDYQRLKAQSSYEGGSAVQTPVRLIQSVGPILADIEKTAAANKFGSFTPANKAKLFLGRLFGTPESLDHQSTVTEGRKQIGSILANGGSPSEADKADANSILPYDASPEQYKQAIETRLPKLLRARGIALSGKDVSIPGIPNTPKGAQGGATPETSFKSADDVRAAVQSGKLPRAEGLAVLRTQFGYK